VTAKSTTTGYDDAAAAACVFAGSAGIEFAVAPASFDDVDDGTLPVALTLPGFNSLNLCKLGNFCASAAGILGFKFNDFAGTGNRGSPEADFRAL
jgi:hypothetical protein